VSWRRWSLVGWCHARALWPKGASYAYSYYGTLIGNPTPGIQWYNFRPPGVTPNRGMGAFCQITLTSCFYHRNFLLIVLTAVRFAHTIRYYVFNALMGTGNYSATASNMKLVHWPLIGGPLYLVQRGGTGRGPSPPRPLLSVPNVTAHLSTASVPTSYYSMWYYNCLCTIKG